MAEDMEERDECNNNSEATTSNAIRLEKDEHSRELSTVITLFIKF